MDNETTSLHDSIWTQFYGPNYGYLLELYEQFEEDPNSVDEETRALFTAYGRPADPTTAATVSTVSSVSSVSTTANFSPEKVAAAMEYVRNIRTYGHLAANTDPIHKPGPAPQLDLSSYGLTEADLASIPAHVLLRTPKSGINNGLDAVRHLRKMYSGRLAVEFNHIFNLEERKWLDSRIESGELLAPLDKPGKQKLLRRLSEVEGFERFLHKTFVGQKRFSIEGVDALVPILDVLVENAVKAGTKNVVMGMAHRGRLNVLAHILHKPYEVIFSEFHASPNKELVPSEGSMGINYGWTGDVKYHLGADRLLEDDSHASATITMANNPSHLEFVDPVVEGIARAAQDNRSQPGAPTQDVSLALAINIHGDAAFPGEGIVAETLNMSQLKGYHTGGTIHIITNNHLGFTAESDEGRSTRYASDLAKGYEIPVVHVSADDPEACIAAAAFAFEYRVKYKKDFLIDLIGYRRFGHNEMDDAAKTQPKLYQFIQGHKTVRELYANELQESNVLSQDEIARIDRDVNDAFKKAYSKVAEVSQAKPMRDFELPSSSAASVPLDQLQAYNEALLDFPGDFHVYPKLKKILERRRPAFEKGEIEWGHAESLAFASILSDGTPIRLTGQDSERGTFDQRHLVLHDVEDNSEYVPLQALKSAKASFTVHNSPLSEGSVLGFEYGYNVRASDTLVLWEAQYGDFANTAQVIFDQFIMSGRAKWRQPTGLVALLPHGYEGQGPEHSSARLERYLQLAAHNNCFIVNATTAAQYYHLLRLQAARLGAKARPLFVMTPKSLLRNPKATSSAEELATGSFQTVLRDARKLDEKKVTRVVLSSGKVSVDLINVMEKEENVEWAAAARVEQLYPFPVEEITEYLKEFPNLEEIIWLQEEPKNQGAWFFVEPRLREVLGSLNLRYVGRPEHAATAEGIANLHNREQERILREALMK